MSDSLKLSDLGGSPAVKFDEIGDGVAGRISSVKRTQQTDPKSGAAKTWDNGEPRLQTVIGVEVDGEERLLYAKGGRYEIESGEGTSMEVAIIEAAVAAGADSITVGDRLEVRYSGLGKPTQRGLNPPKLYRARYTVATPTLPLDDLFSDDHDIARQ